MLAHKAQSVGCVRIPVCYAHISAIGRQEVEYSLGSAEGTLIAFELTLLIV